MKDLLKLYNDQHEKQPRIQQELTPFEIWEMEQAGNTRRSDEESEVEE